jgi:chemotaxis protein CheZ
MKKSNPQGLSQDLKDACIDYQTGKLTAEDMSDRQLFTKIGELARYLDETMRRLKTLENPLANSTNQLPNASETLTELTRMAEEGTHTIMELTEGLLNNHRQFHTGLTAIQTALSNDSSDHTDILGKIGGMADLAASNQKSLMDIITALSFQDLTGQRIAKVVGVLDEVQSRLVELVVVFGLQGAPQEADKGRAAVLLKELGATKTTSIKQDVVDDLLKEFGF